MISSCALWGRRADAACEPARRVPLPPSGSIPKSSGRRAISKIAGITPMTTVQTPSAYHAVSHPQAPVIAWATSGIIARPDPCDTWFKARANGLRRINQLLTATDVPNSSGLEKTIRPGT